MRTRSLIASLVAALAFLHVASAVEAEADSPFIMSSHTRVAEPEQYHSSSRPYSPAGMDIAVSPVTRVLAVKHRKPLFEPPRMRQVSGSGSKSGSFAPSVSSQTKIMNETEFRRTDPTRTGFLKALDEFNKDLWTPDGQPLSPTANSSLVDAANLARRSFILADVDQESTNLYIYYLDDSDPDSPRVSRGVKVGVIGDLDLGASCTGDPDAENVGSLTTSLDEVAVSNDPGVKGEKILSTLAALYTTCKETVVTGLNSPNAGANWGPFKELLKRYPGEKISIRDVVEMWFNNVDIHFDASSGMREVAEYIVRLKRGNVHRQLWRWVNWADGLLRNPNTTVHTFTRVLPGRVHAYYTFLGARNWARTQPLGVKARNMAVVGIALNSVQFAIRVGPTQVGKVFGQSASMTSSGRSSSGKSSGSSSGSGSSSHSGSSKSSHSGSSQSSHSKSSSRSSSSHSSFLETEATVGSKALARSRGPISTIYPLFQNPGELYTKMFFGAGHNALLVKVLILQYQKYHTAVLPGDVISMPCLSQGVTVERRALVSDNSNFEEICWGTTHGMGEPFDTDICAMFGRKAALLEAVSVKDLVFNGTSNFQKCRNLVSEAFDTIDGHVVPNRLTPQFSGLTREDGYFGPRARLQTRHLIISNNRLASMLKKARDNVPGITAENIKRGLSIKQVRLLAQALSGPLFGQTSLKQMGDYDYMLPLVGAHLDILLTDKLRLDESWDGRVHFPKFHWTDGAQEVYGGLLYANDLAYNQKYSRENYVVPLDRNDPEEQPYVDDIKALPSTGWAKAEAWKEKRRERKRQRLQRRLQGQL